MWYASGEGRKDRATTTKLKAGKSIIGVLPILWGALSTCFGQFPNPRSARELAAYTPGTLGCLYRSKSGANLSRLCHTLVTEQRHLLREQRQPRVCG